MELYQLLNLILMPNNNRMVDVEFSATSFVVVRGSAFTMALN